ncbi:MAG: lipoyl(octanoyl) transferase LipB [Burkholderiaceae bacterium]|nr:lipoyl(octanoyl) transferase LipB [Burkholderiaceae bacterium]
MYSIDIRHLGRVDYLPTYEAMQAFTDERSQQNSNQIDIQPAYSLSDQLWICEHNRVFTQGLAGKTEHVLNAGSIPVVQTNRGGQVTYHGPGQVVAYPLMDLKRAGYFVKEYVYRLEEAVIRTLAHFNVTGHRVAGAPGIYVRLDDPGSHALLDQRPQKRVEDLSPDEKSAPINFVGLGKIAALGIKVSRHCTYHGVALNVAMDLEPFSRINPCGYAGLRTVDLSTIGVSCTWDEAAGVLSQKLTTYLAP